MCPTGHGVRRASPGWGRAEYHRELGKCRQDDIPAVAMDYAVFSKNGDVAKDGAKEGWRMWWRFGVGG